MPYTVRLMLGLRGTVNHIAMGFHAIVLDITHILYSLAYALYI